MQRSVLIALMAMLGLAFGPPLFAKSHAQQPANPDQVAAPNKQQPPAPVPVEDHLRRIATALEAANAQGDPAAENQRAKDDLEAQESMAASAYGMSVLTCISLIVSIAALIALFRSLRQTSRAIQDNREMGEAQTRAYLSVVRLRAPQSGPHALVYEISNQGASPARGVDSHHDIYWPDGEGQWVKLQAEGGAREPFRGDVGDVPEEVVVALNALDIRLLVRRLTKDRPARIVVRLKYRDVFGKCFEYVHGCEFYRLVSDEGSDALLYSRVTSTQSEIGEEAYQRDDPMPNPFAAIAA